METFSIKNLTFEYPTSHSVALNNVTISVKTGDFITICGKSGSGKSTLLRLLKPSATPHGEKKGEIFFKGKEISQIDFRAESEKIGLVTQNPENSIVCDKVWHELAFGAESLGLSTMEIRRRVAETSSFFGIESWFHKNVSELSGGQKQMLNLASVMIMHPDVLLLDEPTAQLDPIAAQMFLETVQKINRELGTTVVLAEHRLETAFSMSDCVFVMEGGKIIASGTPNEIGLKLKEKQSSMVVALPSAMQLFLELEDSGECPVTVVDGRKWLEKLLKTQDVKPLELETKNTEYGEVVLEVKDAYFRYKKDSPDVVKGMSLEVRAGEIYAILGGNGTGKTTALSLICGIHKPYYGRIRILGEDREIGMVPQNPQLLFVKKTIKLDLMDMLEDTKLSIDEKELRVMEFAKLFGIEKILSRHPYDVSGGEIQRAALAKVLLTNAKILLLDEPTKGLDAHFKLHFAEILGMIKAEGKTVVMVSHDVEFCSKNADRCALFFDGQIMSEAKTREFFSQNMFYTTAAGRIARNIIPNAVLTEDIVSAYRKNKREVELK